MMREEGGKAMLHELLDPFADCLDSVSLQRLIERPVSPSVQERMAVLAGKANEGSLSPEERSGYEAAINAADIIGILKLKAQRRLATANKQ